MVYVCVRMRIGSGNGACNGILWEINSNKNLTTEQLKDLRWALHTHYERHPDNRTTFPEPFILLPHLRYEALCYPTPHALEYSAFLATRSSSMVVHLSGRRSGGPACSRTAVWSTGEAALPGSPAIRGSPWYLPVLRNRSWWCFLRSLLPMHCC